MQKYLNCIIALLLVAFVANCTPDKRVNSDALQKEIADREIKKVSEADIVANVHETGNAIAAKAKQTEIREKNRATIEKARGELEKLRADTSKVGATVAGAETKLAQQQQMRIVAPRDGRILAITAREGTASGHYA